MNIKTTFTLDGVDGVVEQADDGDDGGWKQQTVC